MSGTNRLAFSSKQVFEKNGVGEETNPNLRIHSPML